MAHRETTVALSGDAGDEMVGGYNRYVVDPALRKRLARTPSAARRVLGIGAERMPARGWGALARVYKLTGNLASFKDKAYKLGPTLGAPRDADDLHEALATEWAAGAATRLDDLALATGVAEPAQRMMLLDGVTCLPDDILAKVDHAAMAVSLETRAPLLDYRVAEVAWRLPLSMKIRDGRGKWALRQVLHRYLSRELVERPKAGFAIAVGQCLRRSLRDRTEDLLSEGCLRNEGYLDVVTIRRLWVEHRSGKRDWTSRLWNVLMLQARLETQ